MTRGQHRVNEEINPSFSQRSSLTVSPPERNQLAIAPAHSLQRVLSEPHLTRPADILHLQHTLGNRAVGNLLSRSAQQRPVVQAKLTVNAPGDQYEQEADRVAEQVMRMPTVPREKLEEVDKPTIMTLPAIQRDGNGTFEVDTGFEQQLNASKGQGQPLPSTLRQEFETKFGADFSGVRVHTDSQANALNHRIQAEAFTTGQDVFFRQGAYEPASKVGQKMIAHELTHVVQQNGASIQRKPIKVTDKIAESQTLGEFSTSHEVSNDIKSVKAVQRRVDATGNNGKALPPTVIQRTIWQYKNGEWKIAERGTKGQHKKPTYPQKNEYFNNVNGKRGKSIGEVRGGLLDRMLQTGSVEKLGLLEDWKTLANDLVKLCKTVNASGRDTAPLEIGIIRLKNEGGKITDAELTKRNETDVTLELATRVKDYILDFMARNGQLKYIERKNWFKNKEGVVDIDLNFYYDRPIDETGRLGMHKDTAGDNLFVNIIFNNKKITPATEWTQDRALPAGAKEKIMEELMPSDMKKHIIKAKNLLPTDNIKVGGKDIIEGGILPKYGYVSWVDELIWHATPTLKNRPVYSDGKKYQRIIDNLFLDNYYTNGVFDFDKYTSIRDVYEAMILLIEKEGTYMNKFWEFNKEQYGHIFSRTVWNAFQDYFKQDLSEKELLITDIKEYPWNTVKWSGGFGEETANDFRNSLKSSEVPTGVMGLERRNSVADILEKVRKAKGKQPRRSFLRTWVRVSKPERNDQEPET